LITENASLIKQKKLVKSSLQEPAYSGRRPGIKCSTNLAEKRTGKIGKLMITLLFLNCSFHKFSS